VLEAIARDSLALSSRSPGRLAYPLKVATEETSPPPAEPSSWSRLPDLDGLDSGEREKVKAAPRPKVVGGATDAARANFLRGASAVGAAIQGGAERMSTHLGEGFDRAKAVLDSPAAPELEALYENTNLPQLVASDPIGSLALRLDGESDLWRSLALRFFARAAWADRITQGAGVLAGLGAVALAVIAGVGALFGAGDVESRLGLMAGSLGALAVGAALVTWISGTIRRAQRELAREAMLRADLAELRLHRVGALVALLQADPDAGKQALMRFERDVSAPPR
jgi:hypothetical protein